MLSVINKKKYELNPLVLLYNLAGKRSHAKKKRSLLQSASLFILINSMKQITTIPEGAASPNSP